MLRWWPRKPHNVMAWVRLGPRYQRMPIHPDRAPRDPHPVRIHSIFRGLPPVTPPVTHSSKARRRWARIIPPARDRPPLLSATRTATTTGAVAFGHTEPASVARHRRVGSARRGLPERRATSNRTARRFASVAQPVEHPPCKREVVGSTPTAGYDNSRNIVATTNQRITHLAVNGIRADANSPRGWPDNSRRWGEAHDETIVPHEYDEPGSILRHWHQYALIENLADAIDLETEVDRAVVVVAHSWGCHLTCWAAKQCHANVRHLHLIAGSFNPDFRKNCLNEMLASGKVRGVTIWRGGRDSALDGWARRSKRATFGLLGFDYGGSMLVPEADYSIDPAVRHLVRFCDRPEFEHSTWFAGDWRSAASNLAALWQTITGRWPGLNTINH